MISVLEKTVPQYWTQIIETATLIFVNSWVTFSLQQEIMNCRSELDSIRMKQADYEHETDRMRRDLAEITGEFEQQTRRCEQLEKEVGNTAAEVIGNKVLIQVHFAYLHYIPVWLWFGYFHLTVF